MRTTYHGRTSLNDDFYRCIDARRQKRCDDEDDFYEIRLVTHLPGGRIIAHIESGTDAMLLIEPDGVHFIDCASYSTPPLKPVGCRSFVEPLEDKPIHLVRRWRCHDRTCRDRQNDCRHIFILNERMPVLIDPNAYDMFKLRELKGRDVSEALLTDR